MILILIFAAIVIAGVILIIIGSLDRTMRNKSWVFKDNVRTAGIFITVIGGLVLLILGLIAIIENANSDLYYKMNQARRDAIVYQMENELYLGSSLGDFNSDLISAKRCHESPWTSWLVGDYVMDLELIPTSTVTTK